MKLILQARAIVTNLQKEEAEACSKIRILRRET